MSDKKIIVVMGATGAQGGGLVRAILDDPEGPFVPRAVTRDASTEQAQALAELGADVVEADLDDPASVEAAFQGAFGAFCVTFFWAHLSPEKEIEHAGVMATAARNAGLKHVVWSTLDDTRRFVPLSDDRMPTLMGKYKVPHFDAKGEADQLFRDAGVPATFLATSFYWDNLIHFGMGPRRGEDGNLVFALPMGDRRLPGMAAEDIGKCAYGVFKRGPELIGKTVGVAGGHPTGTQMAEALGRALGETVSYFAVPFDVYRSFDFPGAEDLGNMFQFKHDFEEEYCASRNLDEARSLNPELKTFEAWVAENKERIPIG